MSVMAVILAPHYTKHVAQTGLVLMQIFHTFKVIIMVTRGLLTVTTMVDKLNIDIILLLFMTIFCLKITDNKQKYKLSSADHQLR